MNNKIIKLTNKDDLNTVMTTLDKDSMMSDGYGIICRTVMTDKSISMQAKAIYAYLASFAGTDGSCYPTVKRIREDLKIKSSDTYYKYLQQLVDAGYVVIYQTRIDNMKSNNVYEIVMSKNRINENKKVASTANTNNLDEELVNNSSKKSNSIKSISHSKENIQEKKVNSTHKNIELLKNSGIKYIPYKKENETILNMDTDKLQKCIDITLNKADKPNWNFLLSTYNNLGSDNRKNQKQVITTQHNINQVFKKYNPDELEKLLLENQKGKFN